MTIGRFAPSPSGRMHIGNVFCALLSYLFAKQQGGQWVLRIEDLDPVRCTPELAQWLEDDLNWLGFIPDAGGLANPDYVQSKRTASYQQAFDKLQQTNEIYPCFCSRADLLAASAPHASDGTRVYAGTCRSLSPAERARKTKAPAYRLHLPSTVITFDDGICGQVSQHLAHEVGDIVLRRADGVFAYQLAVVVDDGAEGITQVVRGRDLLCSTPVQIYLHHLLGTVPPAFVHIPLICAPDGRRLAKRDASLAMDTLRAVYPAGQNLLAKLLYLAGLLPDETPRPLAQCVREADVSRLRPADIVLSQEDYSALASGKRLS